ncbi:hypothetical protein [Xylanimonas sp. McL0601]|uniref:hypothetical protein n=1 Tax=Xylanimonas sp. McL0601 TaxID=3414739 RepID=UPI003CF104C1
MTNTPGTTDTDIVRWYTRARRFPQLIGKTATGGMIWGGPYTYTQVGVGVGFFVIGLQTTWLWGHFGLIGNTLLLAAVSYGLVLIVGRLPIGSRNPLSIGVGALRALGAPAHGTLAATPLRLRRPHHVTSRLVITHDAPTLADIPAGTPTPAARARRRGRDIPESAVATPPAPQRLRPTPATTRSTTTPALTGVQRPLASTGAPRQED